MSALYIIGVGPGDPELITLKAVRLIKEVPVLFVPKGREDGMSLALSIVRGVVDLDRKKILELHFPMIKTVTGDQDLSERWDRLADEIFQVLRDSDAAFLTLGDPCFYSTFFYLYDRLLKLLPSLRIEIIPGVSSINASSAKAGIPLGLASERIAIIPANYLSDKDEWLQLLNGFDTIVFMKVDRNFNELKNFLMNNRLIERSVYLARVGMEGEKVIYDIGNVKKEELDYFSILIVKKGRHYG